MYESAAGEAVLDDGTEEQDDGTAVDSCVGALVCPAGAKPTDRAVHHGPRRGCMVRRSRRRRRTSLCHQAYHLAPLLQLLALMPTWVQKQL